MKHILILLVSLALFPMVNVFAYDDMDMGTVNAKTAKGVGVVDSVDQSKGLVTISHEPIASLNWPAMTMDFSVTNKTFFIKLAKGRKVEFEFIKQHNQYVITGVR